MNKAVLVTGASGGGGLAIAKKFAGEGYAVFVTSRDAPRAESAARLIREECGVFSKGYGLGVSDEAEVISVFHDIRSHGCLLDTAVFNAANLGLDMDPFKVDLEEWAKVILTNVVWNFSVARASAAQMREKGGGSIVFIGSNTHRRALKNRSAYITSKGAIVSMSKALAVDLGRYHIRVNTLAPGSIKTSRWFACSESLRRSRLKRVPIGDITDFDDLSNAAFFLGSDLSKNITGTELVVDGGADAQLFPDDIRGDNNAAD